MPAANDWPSVDRSPTGRWGFDAFQAIAEASAPHDLYLRPVGRLIGPAAVAGIAAGAAAPLADGTAAPTIEILVRGAIGADRWLGSAAEFQAWLARAGDSAAARRLTRLARRIAAPRALWAGFDLGRSLVMGIVNVTPDSFSDGGDHGDADAAIAHARSLRAAGADILDVGGESTRPGAAPVDPALECQRILPVVHALAAEGAIVSVDTRRAVVMEAALAAGARIINDVTALSGDPDSLRVVTQADAPVVLMHMQGEPQTMQRAPDYKMVSLDVFDALERRIETALHAGLARDRIVVDPGIGFGKNVGHNLQILRDLAMFQATGCGVLLGVSRKRFIGQLGAAPGAELSDPKDRLGGSLALGLLGLDQGAAILRVHDVAATAQAIRLRRALEGTS